MVDQAKKGARKKRDDDRRGAPKGTFGNPPFQPTDEQRARVRQLAKAFPHHAQAHIAALLGISEDTLQRHFPTELELGRAEMLANVGAQMISRAIDADAVGQDGKPIAKGDIDAQKYVLARLGGWTTKVEIGGRDGRPIEYVDLSRLSAEELEEYGRLAAKAEGLDPETLLGGPSD